MFVIDMHRHKTLTSCSAKMTCLPAHELSTRSSLQVRSYFHDIKHVCNRFANFFLSVARSFINRQRRITKESCPQNMRHKISQRTNTLTTSCNLITGKNQGFLHALTFLSRNKLNPHRRQLFIKTHQRTSTFQTVSTFPCLILASSRCS